MVSPANQLGRLQNSVFSSTPCGGKIGKIANGHKTSTQSYENTSNYTMMTTAVTTSNMSTQMMMRKRAAEQALKPATIFDPRKDI